MAYLRGGTWRRRNRVTAQTVAAYQRHQHANVAWRGRPYTISCSSGGVTSAGEVSAKITYDGGDDVKYQRLVIMLWRTAWPQTGVAFWRQREASTSYPSQRMAAYVSAAYGGNVAA